MLGYTQNDIDAMQASIEIAKKFFLSHPSDLMNKQPVLDGLDSAQSFFDGLWAEGYLDYLD